MKKSILLVVACLGIGVITNAQSIADAVKLIQYGKAKSAKAILQKMVASNAADADANYWLGQACIVDDDIAAAKDVYQKALQAGANSPYIWIGSAHVDLLQGGDINAAKQKFEQAITSSTETKGRNKGKVTPAVLNAIGRANCIGRLSSDGSSKYGDPMYAIDKLKQAGETDLTTPDYFINMGICYRKMGGEFGGQAQTAYMEALQRDAKSAQANHLLGKIYLSQTSSGSSNAKALMEQYFNAAIAVDPSYPPVYLDFYNYYSQRDVNMAKNNIEKYLQYADKDCKNDFFFADYLFRAGKNDESIAKTKELENTECKQRVNILYAYNYDRKGDSLTAKTNIETFFATATPDKIEPTDYDIAIKVLSRFAGSEAGTVGYIEKAMALDTSKAGKIAYASQAADLWGRAKNTSEQIKWLQKVTEIRGTTSEGDYYKMTNAAFTAKDYNLALNLAKSYLTAFPDKPQPASFLRRSAIALDPDTSLGTALEPLTYLNTILEKDIEKNRRSIFNNLYYMFLYYGVKVKDYPKSIEVLDKMMVLYPTAGTEENNYIINQKTMIQNVMNKRNAPPPPAPATPNPPKTGKGTGDAPPPAKPNTSKASPKKK